MRAAVFEEVGKPLSITTVDDPVPGPGEIVLEVTNCGICGSDLHLTQMPGFLPSGIVLGHEFSGRIVDGGTTGLIAGEAATALPIRSCGHCAHCAEGYIMHCPELRFNGVQLAGGFAQYVAVQADMVQPLPAGVGFEEGALVEPLAVGHRAVGLAGTLAGHDVLILGAGPIGAAATLFAVQSGARNIMVSEPNRERRERAAELGATVLFDPAREDVAARSHAICDGAPAVVIECAGVPGMIGKAIDLARNRGTVIVAGACMEPDTIMPMAALTKELTVRFSSGYNVRDFEAVIAAMAGGRIRPTPLVTDRIEIDSLPAAFEALRQPSGQCKVMVGF